MIWTFLEEVNVGEEIFSSPELRTEAKGRLIGQGHRRIRKGYLQTAHHLPSLFPQCIDSSDHGIRCELRRDVGGICDYRIGVWYAWNRKPARSP